jgi:hypothetical protein
VYVARLICSATECAQGAVAEAPVLREVETLACQCGRGFEVIGWPDHVACGPSPGGEVVRLAAGRDRWREAARASPR